MMMQRVRFLKDFPQVGLAGRKLGPFPTDTETDVWGWEASVLERRGALERKNVLTSGDIRRYSLSEERSSEIEPLSEDFYLSLRSTVAAARAAGDFGKAEELKNGAQALLDVRLPKLLKLALSPESLKGIPPEERFLVNRLASTIDGWSRKLGKILGEEVVKGEFGGPLQHVVGSEASIQEKGVSAP
jgi:hypothetical protein